MKEILRPRGSVIRYFSNCGKPRFIVVLFRTPARNSSIPSRIKYKVELESMSVSLEIVKIGGLFQTPSAPPVRRVNGLQNFFRYTLQRESPLNFPDRSPGSLFTICLGTWSKETLFAGFFAIRRLWIIFIPHYGVQKPRMSFPGVLI